tara:strand:+ start:4094 stop:5161 length:1068 start_codon:yes stop_codon:yes gene_type:complete
MSERLKTNILEIKNNEHVDVFAKYLFNNVGGAEKSTYELLKIIEKSGKKNITLHGIHSNKFGEYFYDKDFLESFGAINNIKNTISISRFPLWEYLINRQKLINEGSEKDSDILWTYGIFGPAFALNYRKKVIFFIRSETDLGQFMNYKNGFERILKYIHQLIEFIPLMVLRHDLKKVLKKAVVVTNSKFMAEKAKELYAVDSTVIYPQVNIEQIKQSKKFKETKKDKIVFVGDSNVKGMQIVKDLAKKFPDETFIIFSRFVQKEESHYNIYYKKWVTDNANLYSSAKIVLVPSQWEEAYGRVAREAYLLDLKVLVSRIGGLSEAVENNDSYLVNNYRDIDSWEEKLKKLIEEINK